MSLKIYTDKKDIPKDMMFINYNDLLTAAKNSDLSKAQMERLEAEIYEIIGDELNHQERLKMLYSLVTSIKENKAISAIIIILATSPQPVLNTSKARTTVAAKIPASGNPNPLNNCNFTFLADFGIKYPICHYSPFFWFS